MRFDIDRIPVAELTVEGFFRRYYAEERPVLLTGLAPPFPGDVAGAVWRLANGPEADPRNGHIAVPMQSGEAAPRTPALVGAVFARDDIVHKPKPLKLWMQPNGHRSLLHYDGNSLHGLNWQVAGRKHWLLLSAETPARMVPLSWVAMVDERFEPDPREHEFCEFETAPGDLLFLPRYWSHRVTCLESVNANLDWVWTPTRPNRHVRAGRRECATLRLRSWLGKLDRFVFYRVSLDNYADGGPRLFDAYTAGVGVLQVLSLLAGELVSLALMPWYARAIDRQMHAMRSNNFPPALASSALPPRVTAA